MKQAGLLSMLLLSLTPLHAVGFAAPPTHPLTSPDLTIVDITVFDGIGPEIDFTVEIKNEGTDSTKNAFLIRAYLSDDQTITDSDYLIKQVVYTPSIPPAVTFLWANYNIMVTGVPTGTYYLGVIVDVLNQVSESNENNNSDYDHAVMLVITGLPELAFTASHVEHRPEILPHVYRYTLTYRNQGPESPSLPYIIRSYLSTDTQITTADYPVKDHSGQIGLPPYSGEVNIQEDFDAAILGIPAGDYFFGLFVDPLDTITEENESNNTVSTITALVNVPATEVEHRTDRTPERFELYQNQPNPFNTETIFMYDLPEATETIITIFNIQGIPVRTYHRITQMPGTFTSRWGGVDDLGREVPSGIYFCRVQAGNHSGTIRMLLMK
jgi:hypothetical protein